VQLAARELHGMKNREQTNFNPANFVLLVFHLARRAACKRAVEKVLVLDEDLDFSITNPRGEI
jgi:hypothetical protein